MSIYTAAPPTVAPTPIPSTTSSTSKPSTAKPTTSKPTINVTQSPTTGAPIVKPDGACGADYGNCPSPQCCSYWGYCGTSEDYCADGCQSPYGSCTNPEPDIKVNDSQLGSLGSYVADLDPTLAQLLASYNSAPTDDLANSIRFAVARVFITSSGISRIQALLQANNPVYVAEEAKLAGNRASMCDAAPASLMSQALKDCVCGTSLPMIHCQSLFELEVYDYVVVAARREEEVEEDEEYMYSAPAPIEFKVRGAPGLSVADLLRGGTAHELVRSIKDQQDEQAYLVPWQLKDPYSRGLASCSDGGGKGDILTAFLGIFRMGKDFTPLCFSYGCSVPIPGVTLMSVDFSANICVPMVDPAPVEGVSVCIWDGTCSTLTAFSATSQLLESFKASLRIGICISGTDNVIVKRILSFLAIDPCLLHLDLAINFVTGLLSFSGTVSILGFNFSIGLQSLLFDDVQQKLGLCQPATFQNLGYDNCGDAYCQLCKGETRGFGRIDSSVWLVYMLNGFHDWKVEWLFTGTVRKTCAVCTPPPPPVDNNGRRLVIYTTSWAQYRLPGTVVSDGVTYTRPATCQARAQKPDHIPSGLATHINYAFVGMNSNFDVENYEWDDDDLMAKLNALKTSNSELKTLISIGGWNFCKGLTALYGGASATTFSNMASSSANRAHFITSAINYATAKGFNGIDIDWEYPSAAEKDNFTALLKELRDAITARGNGFVLSIAAPAGPDTYANINLGAIHQYVDYINLMTYDFHGGSFEPNGPLLCQTPIHVCNGATGNAGWNIDKSVSDYLAAGVPANKINLGLATYGRTWGISGAAPSGAGPAGDCTITPGVLAYYEVKSVVSGVTYDDDQMCAKAYYGGGTGWVGYDDQHTMQQKSCWGRYKGLGGVMFFDGEMDDNLELTNYVKSQLSLDYPAACSNVAFKKSC